MMAALLLEQEMEDAIKEAKSMHAVQRLCPVDLNEIRSEEGLLKLAAGVVEREAELFQEIAEKGKKERTEPTPFDLVYNHFGSGASLAASRHLAEKNFPFPDYYLVVRSVENIAEGKHAWMAGRLLSNEEALLELFRLRSNIPSGILSEETLDRFAEHLPENAIELYEENLHKYKGGSYESKLLMQSTSCADLLARAIPSGKVDSSEVVRFFKKLSKEKTFPYYSNGFSLGVLARALPSGKISAAEVVGVYRDYIKKGVEEGFCFSEKEWRGGFEHQKIFPSNSLGELARQAAAGLVSGDEVLELYESAFRKQEAIAEAALEDFGEVIKGIPSGNFDPDRVIQALERRIDVETEENKDDTITCFVTLVNKSLELLVDSVSPKRLEKILGLYMQYFPGQFSDLSFQRGLLKLAAELPRESLPRLYDFLEISRGTLKEERYLQVKYELDAIAESGEPPQEAGKMICPKGKRKPTLPLTNSVRLLKYGKKNSAAVVRRFMDWLRKGRVDEKGTARSLEELAKAVPSGSISTAKAINIFERYITRKREEGYIPDQTRSHSIAAASALRELAKLIPSDCTSQEDAERIFGIYEKALKRISLVSNKAASSLDEIAKAVPSGRISAEQVVGIYRKAISTGTVSNADIAAKKIPALAELVNSGQISPEDFAGLYTLALENRAWEGVIESLPSLAAMLPEKAIEVCEKMHSMASNVSFEPTPAKIGGQRRKCDSAYKAIVKIAAGSKTRIEQKTRFVGLALAFRKEWFSMQELEMICAAESREHEMTNDGIIIGFVQKRYGHLKQYEKELAVKTIKDVHKLVKDREDLTKEGGYSSIGVIDMTDDVAKAASIAQNRREDLVYSQEWAPDDLIPLFIPRKRGIIELKDDLSILIMENLENRPVPGWVAAGILYHHLSGGQPVPWFTENDGHNRAMLDMFLLGIEHKSLRGAAERGTEFPETQYISLAEGIPQCYAIKVPLKGGKTLKGWEGRTSHSVYSKHMKPVPQKLVDKCWEITSGFLRVARHDPNSIIIGDNKIIENMKNGYPHDFAMVGKGAEIEDIAYGLVEPRLGIPLTSIRGYAKAYITMRCLHDRKFAARSAVAEQEMMAFMDGAIITALGVYAGCTRKRVEQMESGEIIPRRNYFINALKFMIGTGYFSDITIR